MNKPITSRVRQATSGSKGVQEPLLNVGAAGVRGGAATKKQPSPLKLGGGLGRISEEAKTTATVPAAPSAGSIVTSGKPAVGEATSKKPGLIAKGRASGGNSSLISGASKVSGTSSTIPRATDINAAASSAESGKSSFTGSTTVGGAIQRNIAARIDKAGELGRARRDARRAGKGGASVNAAPSAEKVARDERVDAVIGGNSSASAIDNKMPSVDLVGMGAKAKAAAQPSVKDIRKEGRAERKSSRQASRADKASENKANREFKAEQRQGKLTMKQNKRQDKKEGPAEIAGKSPSISVNNKGAQLQTPSLGSRSTTNASNKDYNEALMTRMNANEDAQLSAGLSKDDRNKPMGSESAAKMRMDSNVGIKSKSPMKKGYFNKK